MPLIEGVARAVWRAFIPAFFSQGYTFRGAIAMLRGLGYGLRTTVALTDWRSINGLIRGQYAARNVDPAKRYPQNKMVETDLGRAYKYRVYGQATYTNIATGEESSKIVSLYTNTWFSKQGWAKEFERWKEKMEYETGWLISNVDMKVAEHNAGFSY